MTAVGFHTALDLFTVSHAGGLQLGLHAEAALQLGAEHVQLNVAQAGEHLLAGLGVVEQIEGDILLVESGKASGHLVVLALGLGRDGHGVAGFGHLDGGQLHLVLGVAHGVAGLPVHLANGHDVAAAGFLYLGGLLAADGVQTAQLIGAGGADVAQGHIGSDLALHHLHEAVLTELVGNGLEHEANGAAGGLDTLHLGGVGNVVHNTLQQGLGADAGHGGAGEHGHHTAVLQAGADAGDHLGLAQLHGVKVLLHQLLGGAGGGLHQGLPQLLHLVRIGGGDSDLGGLAALGLVSGVMHNINDAGAVGGGDGDGADDAAVFGLQGVQNLEVIAVLLIALGDAESNGDVGGLQVFPCPLSADRQPVLGGAEDDAGFGGADGSQGLAHKVKEAGAVQHVDLAAAEINGGYSGGNGDLALDFLRVIVADGVAVADLTHAVDSAGAEQHALSKAGLAAVAMAQQADVADVFGFVAHVLLPLLV